MALAHELCSRHLSGRIVTEVRDMSVETTRDAAGTCTQASTHVIRVRSHSARRVVVAVGFSRA